MSARKKSPWLPATRTLVFSHANGFAAPLYESLFARWRSAGWRVLAMPQYGHDPAWPVTDGWPRLREQLADLIQREEPGGSVALVGHSLGGMLSLMVACRHPALVHRLVMLDSPVVAGWRAQSVRLAKLARLMQRFGPGHISARRRTTWPDRAAVLQHFAAKRAFARWAPEVLAAYVQHGFEEGPDGKVHLAFKREVETRIYNTLPHTLERTLHRHPPRCPLHFIAGTHSAENRQAGMAATKALVGEGGLHWIEGSHLFPMEKPIETADLVLRCLAAPA